MTKYASINPTNIPVGINDVDNTGFAALVHVKSSRYVKYEYQPESGIAPKIGIEWSVGTTKGNTFDRKWSIGVPWEGNENAISSDGKKCSVSIKRNSDAFYMIERAIASGFPAEKLTDDISVFEGETFLIADGKNPKSAGSSKKPYPKKYHPEGWDAAKEASLQRRAAREAQQNAPAYTAPNSSYAPPAVVQTDNNQVLAAAGEVLAAVLAGGGGSITRNELPKQVNAYIEQKQRETGSVWDSNFRRDVAIALWDIGQLTSVVNSNPNLVLNGETVSFK